MQIVVDSNILFAALIRDSMARKVLLHLNSDFLIISVNLEEIAKYKRELLEKSNMNEISFDLLLEQLTKKCIRIKDESVKENWEEAKKIMWDTDPKDTPFIAAALTTGADIWSDDKHFTEQTRIKIWKTADLAKLL